MDQKKLLTILAVLVVGGLAAVVLLFSNRRTSRIDARIKGLKSRGAAPEPEAKAVKQFAKVTLPKVGSILVPTDEESRTRLQGRLVHAGLYSKGAMAQYLGVKLLLMISPTILGFIAAMFGLLSMKNGLLGASCLGVIGVVGPSRWLAKKKAKRQLNFRRALPDALDVLVICVEGGLSLPGALKRVAVDLRSVHPALAAELNIVQREVQLGRSAGEALRNLGERTDLEELQSLASVITQAERFGAGLVKSLRVHGETLRHKRKQKAEELAQKASTKILFPTLLFIFPSIFVVILGPAAFQLSETFATMAAAQ